MNASIEITKELAATARKNRPALPPVWERDALIDIRGVQALTCMSTSWIHDAIRRGRFPAPVIRETRCTRWRVGDVRDWLRCRIEQAVADSPRTNGTSVRAKAASEAARLKRIQLTSSAQSQEPQ